MSRVKCWPSRVSTTAPTASAISLASFLADVPVPISTSSDANLYTHTQVACMGLNGIRVHRLDSARGLKFYTTRCGLRVAKAAGVLTATAVDCSHSGCTRREQETDV